MKFRLTNFSHYVQNLLRLSIMLRYVDGGGRQMLMAAYEGEGGVKNRQNLAYVVYGCTLIKSQTQNKH